MLKFLNGRGHALYSLQYAGYLTVCFLNSKCETTKGNGVM